MHTYIYLDRRHVSEARSVARFQVVCGAVVVCKALTRKLWQVTTCLTLMAYGAKVDASDLHGHQALHWASYMGRSMVVQLLLRSNADIHARDGELRTPLHRAVQQSHHMHLEVALLLLSRGAQTEENEGGESNNMMKMAKESRGQALRQMADLLAGSRGRSNHTTPISHV
jgi:hypothetical protein